MISHYNLIILEFNTKFACKSNLIVKSSNLCSGSSAHILKYFETRDVSELKNESKLGKTYSAKNIALMITDPLLLAEYPTNIAKGCFPSLQSSIVIP